jgi:hypothetical protein
LRFQHMSESLEQFLTQRPVLPLKIEQGDRLLRGPHLSDGGYYGVLHFHMVTPETVERLNLDRTVTARHRCSPAELKRSVNPAIVDTLRDLADPGFPVPSPWFCIFTEVQIFGAKHSEFYGKQEIGKWKTSRHRIFRTRS